MSKFVVPNIFIAGTKAKAQEVNENFSSMQDELEKKALKVGDKEQPFFVADAIEDNHAVSKSQVQTLVDNVKETTIAKLDSEKLSLFAKSGNVDSDGNSYLISFSGMELNFLVGGLYKKLIGNIQGESVEISEISDFSMNGYADGTYNVFVDSEGEITVLENNVYIQPNEPEMVVNDVWVNTSAKPFEIKQYNGTGNVEFEKIWIGKVVVNESAISTVETLPFNSIQATNVNHSNSARIIKSYKNGNSWYRIWSDGWLEQGGTLANDQHLRTINFLVSFKDTSYCAVVTAIATLGFSWGIYPSCTKDYLTLLATPGGTVDWNWYACGYKE